MTCPVCGTVQDAAAEACATCGADLTVLAPGTLVAERYEIRRLLGRGGMGTVYRAFDRVLHEDVALKLRRPDGGDDPDAERRFRDEVRLARQVTHPFVCRIHDGGVFGARRWISMEVVDGETLAARLKGGRVPLDEAWALALQAAEGLAAVHRAGVVHRDFKPLNLMLDRQGRLRLMDFGIAKQATGHETGGTATGYALGSPEYMSPEQARGRPADARSDVYALGIVLYEVFTGRVPFRSDTPVATLLQQLETAPPLEAVPEPPRAVLARALSKDPAARYADAGEMLDALRRARGRADLPTATVRTPAAPPARRAVSVAATLALAAVAVAVAYTWRTGHPSASPQASPPAAEVTPSPPAAPATTTTTAPRPPEADRRRPTTATAAVVPVAAPTAASVTEPPEQARPTPLQPTPTPAPEASAPAATPIATPAPNGTLLILVRPWADVTVDGVARGQTPLGPIALAPGPHSVLLTHPDYRPYRRRVTIRPGETLRLSLDWTTDGVRLKP